MWQGTPWKSAVAVLTALLVAGASPVFSQSQNSQSQNPNPTDQRTPVPGPPSTTDQPNPVVTKPKPPRIKPPLRDPTRGPTGQQPVGTTGTGGRNTGSTGRGSTTGVVPPHHTTGGGGNGGAIAAAITGIGLFESLHREHVANSGQRLERLGLSLRYPEDWQLNPRLNLQEDPINFNNFNSSYLRGGIIPMGGADIDIAYFPSVNGPVPELISNELADTNEKRMDEHTYQIGGKKGTRVFYTDVYARGFTYKNVAVYVPREDGLYKFFLTYHEGDQHEKAFNDDFEHILKSVRFER